MALRPGCQAPSEGGKIGGVKPIAGFRPRNWLRIKRGTCMKAGGPSGGARDSVAIAAHAEIPSRWLAPLRPPQHISHDRGGPRITGFGPQRTLAAGAPVL